MSDTRLESEPQLEDTLAAMRRAEAAVYHTAGITGDTEAASGLTTDPDTPVATAEPDRAPVTVPLDPFAESSEGSEVEVDGAVTVPRLGSSVLGGDEGSADVSNEAGRIIPVLTQGYYSPDGHHNGSTQANVLGHDGWDDGSDDDSDKLPDTLIDSSSSDFPTPESALATPERKPISDDMRKAAIALLVVMEEDEEDYEPLGNDLFSVYIEPHLSNYDYDEATLADLTNPEFMREASEYDKLVAKMIRSMRGIGPKLDDKERARYAELHDKFDGGIVGRMDDVEVAINTCVDRWGPVLNAAPALMVGGAFVSAEEGSEDDDSPKTLKAQIRAVARELLSEDDRKKYDALVAQAIEHHTSRDLSEIGDLVDPDEKSHSAVAADLEGQIRDIIATTREDATQRVLEVARYVLHLNKMSTVA